MESVVVASSALVVGFLAGLLAFRQKSRWCPVCGSTFTCPNAHRHDDIDRAQRPRRRNMGRWYRGSAQ